MDAPERTDRPIAALLAPDILALLDDDPASVAAETEELHPADLADVVEAIPRERVPDLLNVLGPARAADVLEYLDETVRTETIEAMTARQAATIVREMSPDDRADVLEEIEETHADDILAEIPADERRATEELLSYDPDTAGGLMTTEFVSVPESVSVEDALGHVRAAARSGRREAMYAIYTTDDTGRLRGVISLRALLAAPEGTSIAENAWSEVVTVPVDAEAAEITRITSEYDLVAVPVVDADNRLVGVITVDDVIDVIQEEQTEDVQKLGGMAALDEPYMQMSLGAMFRKRVVWMCVLFMGSLITANVIGHFETALNELTILALFIPLIISSGGNSGSQATSLIIRAMALDEVSLKDWWRVAKRELASGMALGAVLAVLGFARIVVWQLAGWHDHGAHYLRFALTIGLALLGVVTFGSLTGSMLPFVLKRLNLDPASASAPFVATLVDVTGLMIYFGVAVLVLGNLG